MEAILLNPLKISYSFKSYFAGSKGSNALRIDFEFVAGYSLNYFNTY